MSAMTFTSSQILSVAPTRNGSIVPAVDLAPMSENLEIASYKGNMVSVKRLCKIGIILNRPDHMELKIVSTAAKDFLEALLFSRRDQEYHLRTEANEQNLVC